MHPTKSLLALAVLLTVPGFAQDLYNRNLIVNGSAEEGTPLADAYEGPPTSTIPGWTKSGNLSIAPYGKDNFLDTSVQYGIIGHGSQYFVGGPGGGLAHATQVIDISAAAADVDAGKIKFHISGFLGIDDLKSTGLLKATFKGATGAVLLEKTLQAGDWTTEQDEMFVILRRTLTGWVLPGTRSIELLLDLTNQNTGRFNVSTADCLELVLSATPVYGSEFVINGTGEGLELPELVPGWNAMYGFGTAEYTTADDCFNAAEPCIPRTNPGPENRGDWFFRGSPERDRSAAYQTIDVTLIRDAIDSGSVSFAAAAWLGGFLEERDEVTLQINFLNAAGVRVGGQSIGPIPPAERANKSALLEKKLAGSVTSGTRQIEIRLDYRRFSDMGISANHGYADNISFSLSMPIQGIDIQPSRIYNTATQTVGPIAPGEMIEIAATGINMSGESRMQLNAQGRVSTELAGVRVFFDGTEMPLLYVNASRIGGLVPYDVSSKASAAVRVEYQGSKSNTIQLQVAKTAPGIFTQEAGGKGRAVAYDEKWQLNSADNAAAKGATITIMWTGGGQTNPGGIDGRMETQSLPKLAETPAITIDGQTAEILYAGAVPYSWSGLLMVQARIPQAAPTGTAVPLLLTTAGASTQSGVTLAIR